MVSEGAERYIHVGEGACEAGREGRPDHVLQLDVEGHRRGDAEPEVAGGAPGP